MSHQTQHNDEAVSQTRDDSLTDTDIEKNNLEANVQASNAVGPQETNAAPQDPIPEDEYPPMAKALVIMISLFLSMFLVALDRLIVSTAIPTMTNEFHSFGDIGWYGSAYLLCCCSLQVFFGKLYQFYSPKWLYIGFIFFFEVGSAICGAAPNSNAFIWGRAIAGAASAGVQTGTLTIMMNIIPLHKRAAFQAAFGAVFGVSSIAGPLIGGAFTSNVTWRWCFYINLPIGGVIMAVNLLLLKLPQSMKKETPSLKEQLNRLDPLGTLVFIPTVVCLVLALQWGGTQYPWSDGRVIALFVCFGVGLLIFIGIQLWKKENGTIPLSVITDRTVAAGSFYTFVLAGAMLTIAYWLPVWFQAIKGSSAVESGIQFLPTVLGLVVSSMLTGAVVNKTGYYTPPMLLSAVLMPIGAGLLTTLKPSTGSSAWIGYQVIFGLGIGMGMQMAALAVQAVLPKKTAPIGVALFFFFNTLAGAVFVSVGQTLVNNKLVKGFATIPNLPISPEALANQGATEIRNAVSPDRLPLVLNVYNDALVNTFYLVTGLASACILGAVLIPHKKIVKPPKQKKPEAAKEADAQEKELGLDAAGEAKQPSKLAALFKFGKNKA